MAAAASIAARLYRAGGIALALVPVAMALANRSSPLVVAIAALAFLAGLIAEKGLTPALAELAAPLRNPLGLAALAFLAWCAVSLAWSPFPSLWLRTTSEFAPTLAAAYCAARIAPGRMSERTASIAAIALAAACLFVLVSLAIDLAPQKALGQRAADFGFNRPVVTFLLVAIGLGAFLISRRRPVGALAIGGTVAITVLRSVSGSAVLGLAAAIAMAVLALVLPKRAAIAIAVLGLGIGLVLAPVEGDLLEAIAPDSVHARLFESSSRARVAIARSFGAAVAVDSWLGAGYGMSARFAETAAAQRLEPEMRTLLAVGHPHNSFLQVWAELGLPGAILAALTLLMSLRALGGLPRAARVAALALVAAAAAIAFVDHAAWAAWWTAGLGTAITWLRAASREAGATGPEPR